MPYPNEHSCRLVAPGKCQDDSFKRESGGGEHNGKKYDIIWADLKDSGETVRQAHRYPKDNWTEAEARSHCNSLDSIKFEPATKGANQKPDLFGQPWAITEFGLEMVQGAAEQAGVIEAILARAGDRPRGAELTQIRDGVAIIEVIGPIFHYENIVTWITGFPSAEGLMQEIQAANDNPEVDSIVLQIDSPGGQVGGVSELSKFIRTSDEKPIIAYVGDMAASAAYWIAAAADEIVAADTAEIGSIGVVFSMRRRQNNSLEIVSSVSPKKRPDPETDDGRRVIQERADAIAEVFVQAVMEYRALTREQAVVLQGNMAIASSAVDLALVDRIGSLEGLIAEIKDSQYGGNSMTLSYEKLKADHAEMFEQVKEEGRGEARQEVEGVKTQARTEGVKEGQDGTLALVEAVLGAEAKAQLDKVIEAGLTADQVKVSRDLFGGKESDQAAGEDCRQKILEGLEASTPPAAPNATEGDEKGFETLVDEYQQKHGCKRSKAIGAVAAQNPELHEAWLKGQQKK